MGFEFVLAILGLVFAFAALALGRQLKNEIRQLSAGVDSAIQTASRARVASDAAAATLSRDQDELWRMRSDVDGTRNDATAIRDEIQAVRNEIEGVRKSHESHRQNLLEVRKDVEAVRRVLIGLRDDLEDVRKEIEVARNGAEASPLPIPPQTRGDALQALREQLKAEQQVADPDDDDR